MRRFRNFRQEEKEKGGAGPTDRKKPRECLIYNGNLLTLHYHVIQIQEMCILGVSVFVFSQVNLSV